MIIQLKKGNKIHIKESLKGSFTRWCGGNVTDECIRRGKNSSNPKIRKKATFALNARGWKHLLGGVMDYQEWLNMTPELLQDYRNNRASAYIQENLSLGNLFKATKAYLGGYDPENPYILKLVAPDILPGKIGSYKNAKSLLKETTSKPQIVETKYTLSGTSSERFMEGKRYGISKKGRVSSNDKNARAMEKSDARITNAGNTNLRKAQLNLIEMNLHKYPLFEQKAYDKGLIKAFRKGGDEGVRKYKREFFKRLAELYGYFNQGGKISKAAGGTKLNFGLKIGNFLNSDLGKGVISLGSSLISGISNSSKAADFSNEFNNTTEANARSMEAKLRAKNYSKGLLYALLYLNYLNLNSDVHYGTIDLQQLANLFADLLFDEDEILNYKLQRELEKQLLLQAIQGSSSGFGDILSLGLNLVGNYLGNKKSSTTSVEKNLLSTSTIGKSTNPYMNTSLGGFANNPTNINNWSPTVRKQSGFGSFSLG